ncbi:MAG: type 1 fimbrial protein, partial [Dyella sp.]|nr:type 1 fimbrial protein [Dyella sp.]
MNKLLLSAAMATVFGMAALAPTTASAYDGQISFTGNITAKTCTVKLNGGSSATGTVALPTVSTSAFSGVNSTAGQTAFSIAVSGCSTGMANVATYFEAGSTVNSAGRLITSGTATGLDLQLLYSDGSVVNAGQGNSSVATTTPGQATITSNAATLNYTV